MRAFVTAWALAGALVLTTFLVLRPGSLRWSVLLVAVAAATMQSVTVRSDRDHIYGLEEFAVGVTAVLAHTGLGLLAFVVGIFSAELLLPRHRGIRGVFNASVNTIGCAIALVVAAAIVGASGAAQVLAAGVAVVIFSVVCSTLSATATARYDRIPYLAKARAIISPSLITLLIGLCGGMLLAGIATVSPWAVVLAISISIPVMLWSRARERARHAHAQMQDVLTAITNLQRIRSSDRAQTQLVESARRLTGASRTWIQATEPTDPKLLAVELPLQHSSACWLVTDSEPAPSMHLSPGHLLSALAGAAAAALDSAYLTDQLHQQASQDPLTGLINRRAFDQELCRQAARAQRTEQAFAVCYLDLDRFKSINDNHGHDAGDQLLAAVAAALTATLRTGDVAARLGGDEFAVLLTGVDTEAELSAGIRRIVRAVTSITIMTPDGTLITPACSVGAARYPHEGVSIAALLTLADTRMYENKRARRLRQPGSPPS